jgi:hypothetical protein
MIDLELKEGMYILLVGQAVPAEFKDVFLQILSQEPLDYQYTFSSSVSSGATSGYENIEYLEPDETPLHLSAVLWGIKDGCEYQIKIPTGTDRMGVDGSKSSARITNRDTPYFAPNPHYGFYLIHDLYPSIQANNVTPNSVTPILYFTGYKFGIARVTDDQILQRLRNFATHDVPYIPSKQITLGGIE